MSLGTEQLKRILSFGFAIQEADGKISLPDFPLDSMYALVRIMVSNFDLLAGVTILTSIQTGRRARILR